MKRELINEEITNNGVQGDRKIKIRGERLKDVADRMRNYDTNLIIEKHNRGNAGEVTF